MPGIYTIRIICYFGGLLSLFLLEERRPFKPWVDPRWKRLGRNLLLSVINSFALEILLSAFIVTYFSFIQDKRIGLLNWLGIRGAPGILLTILFMDLITYLWHRAYHEVPVMWRLHRVHHSDRDLDVTSANRFHLLEILLSTAYRLAWLVLWGPTREAVLVFETLMLASNQIQHSNIRLPGRLDDILRPAFVTPDMHRVHHSQVKAHTNSNYSAIFSFWDRLFQTYRFEGIGQESIRIGLAEYPKAEDVTLGRVLLMPLGPACK